MVFLDSIPHFDNQIGAHRSEVFFNSSISICTRNVNRFNKSSLQPLSHLCVSQHRHWLWAVSQCNGDVSCTVKRSEISQVVWNDCTSWLKALSMYIGVLFSMDLFFSQPLTLPYQTYELLYMSIKIEIQHKKLTYKSL